MIPNDSLGIVSAILFYIFAKFLCFINFGPSMHKKEHLCSIPEKNEIDEDVRSTKWVPKKKHEVLKAKYKCLKKLFQIYDASVIGILPETYDQQVDSYATAEDTTRRHHSRRKKRSSPCKTDACAGTMEMSSGDVSVRSEEKGSIASAVMRELKIQCSCSTQMISEDCPQKSQPRLDRPSSLATDNYTEQPPPSVYQVRDERESIMHPMPYLMYSEQKKPTRFQIFIQRLFGIRREMRAGCGSEGHIYAASDNNITYNYSDKRRRRGLRFRRLRRPKKTHSETILRDVSSPAILNFVQSVQKNCLKDRTPRHCPILGCKMLFYGIINYNDHLNLCHFTDRKFTCHYCHEGFELEYEKYEHENEHLGVIKIKPVMQNITASSTRQSQKSSNTQTDEAKSDVPEEKLKKIVSFFDKIADTDKMLADMKRQKYSEYNMPSTDQSKSDSATESETATGGSGKRVVSCGNLPNRRLDKIKSSNQSDFTSKCHYTPMKCHICGEDFDYRRQLSQHVNLEHGHHDKPSKFHSCAGIADYRRAAGVVNLDPGKINIQSLNDISQPSSSTITPDIRSVVSRQKSEATLSCDPSTNIIYYPSIGSVKPSTVNTFADKVRSGIAGYRWEPGTKIIRV